MAAVCVLVFGCAPRTAGPDERVLVHTVRADETLETIAEDYYGGTRGASRIRSFNEIERGNEPEAGTELRIPMTAREMIALELRRAARKPYNEGLELVARGSFLDATSRFREALELDPKFVEARFNLGVTLVRMEAHERAVDELRRAVKARPDNPDYRYALGNAYFHGGRYGRAIGEFRRALRLEPGHLKARFSLALALERDGQPDRARDEWQRYLELDPDSDWAKKARSHLGRLTRP